MAIEQTGTAGPLRSFGSGQNVWGRLVSAANLLSI